MTVRDLLGSTPPAELVGTWVRPDNTNRYCIIESVDGDGGIYLERFGGPYAPEKLEVVSRLTQTS